MNAQFRQLTNRHLAGLVGFILLGASLVSCLGDQGSDDSQLLDDRPLVILKTDSPASPIALAIVSQVNLPTEMLSPSPTAIATEVQETIAATTGSQCTVRTNLNLRSGPGTAYRPPLTALEGGTELTPIGFNPVGVPGGPWVQVRVHGQELTGWISAGEQFISCNIELSTLPIIVVDPPPPPPPPKLVDSAPDGLPPESWFWEVDFSPAYLLRFIVYDEASGVSYDGSGIAEVVFMVIDPTGTLVYQHADQTPAFCIFGGGEPTCNPWIIEDYTYKWKAGGPIAVSGDYLINVTVQGADGKTTGTCSILVNIQFP
jgi:hypothetical protein